MWSGAKTLSLESIVVSEPSRAAFRSIPRSSGSNCNRSPKAPASPQRSYGESGLVSGAVIGSFEFPFLLDRYIGQPRGLEGQCDRPHLELRRRCNVRSSG